IAQYIGGGNAHHIETSGSQPCFPSPVALGIVAHVVRYAIDLDHQPPTGAVEIHDEVPDRMVIAEFHAERALAELLPKQSLGQAHFAALPAGRNQRLTGVIFHQSPSVSP